MKSKVLVNLVLALLLTGVVLFAFFRPREQSAAEIRLTQLKREDINRYRDIVAKLGLRR